MWLLMHYWNPLGGATFVLPRPCLMRSGDIVSCNLHREWGSFHHGNPGAVRRREWGKVCEGIREAPRTALRAARFFYFLLCAVGKLSHFTHFHAGVVLVDTKERVWEAVSWLQHKKLFMQYLYRFPCWAWSPENSQALLSLFSWRWISSFIHITSQAARTHL